MKELILLLPLLFPNWGEKPFNANVLTFHSVPKYMTNEVIDLQTKAFGLDEPRLIVRTLRLLGRSNNEHSAQVLIDFLGKIDEPKLQEEALYALLKFNKPKGSIAIIERLTKSENPAVKAAAFCAYARYQNASQTTVLDYFKKADDIVCLRLIKCLSDNTKAKNETWLKIFQSNKSTAVKALALERLLKTNASQELIDEVVASNDLLLKVTLLDHIHGELSEALALKLLTDEHSSVRSSVARLMGREQRESFSQALISLCQDSSSIVRLVAADSLKAYPRKECVEALYSLFNDEQISVARKAAKSVVFIDQKLKVATIISKGIVSSKERTRRWSYFTLGKVVAVDYGKEIRAALKKEKSEFNIKEAIFALGSIKYSHALVDVCKFVKHPSKYVRGEVAYYIGNTRSKQKYSIISALIAKDLDSYVRNRGLYAIGLSKSLEYFSPILVKALKEIEKKEPAVVYTSHQERVTAMWSISQLDNLDLGLFKQLIRHTTEAIVPGEQFEMDNKIVLIAGSMAVTVHAKKAKNTSSEGPSVKNNFGKVTLKKHYQKLLMQFGSDLSEEPTAYNKHFQQSHITVVYGKEAKDYYEGRESCAVARKRPNPEVYIRKSKSSKSGN